MTCNDVLKRLRYIFDYGDADMVAVFAAADQAVTEEQVRHWLIDEDNPLFAKLHDRELATFLNGLINHKRGKKPGPAPVPENRLTNNLIVTKLKIALNLRGEDMIRILALADFKLSNHELSAFFRKPGHKHFRKMNDQVMRNFLQGLQLEFRQAG
jgi:uncharacterized protein YehS (DUF1456 family)